MISGYSPTLGNLHPRKTIVPVASQGGYNHYNHNLSRHIIGLKENLQETSRKPLYLMEQTMLNPMVSNEHGGIRPTKNGI